MDIMHIYWLVVSQSPSFLMQAHTLQLCNGCHINANPVSHPINLVQLVDQTMRVERNLQEPLQTF